MGSWQDHKVTLPKCIVSILLQVLAQRARWQTHHQEKQYSHHGQNNATRNPNMRWACTFHSTWIKVNEMGNASSMSHRCCASSGHLHWSHTPNTTHQSSFAATEASQWAKSLQTDVNVDSMWTNYRWHQPEDLLFKEICQSLSYLRTHTHIARACTSTGQQVRDQADLSSHSEDRHHCVEKVQQQSHFIHSAKQRSCSSVWPIKTTWDKKAKQDPMSAVCSLQ